MGLEVQQVLRLVSPKEQERLDDQAAVRVTHVNLLLDDQNTSFLQNCEYGAKNHREIQSFLGLRYSSHM